MNSILVFLVLAGLIVAQYSPPYNYNGLYPYPPNSYYYPNNNYYYGVNNPYYTSNNHKINTNPIPAYSPG